MAVLGRPNAGKSTLVNRLLGEERVLTQDQPGTTRDAVSADFEFDGAAFTVVDTAGVRRRSRIDDPLEKFSVIKALQAAEAAEVVVLMIDARGGVAAQDARLLGLITERGRAAVVAVNKWDGLEAEDRDRIRLELEVRLPFLDTLPICYISALHGSGLRELMRAVVRARTAAAADLPTSELSRVLEKAVAAHAPRGPGQADQAALRPPGRAFPAAHRDPRQPHRALESGVQALPDAPLPRGLRPVRHADRAGLPDGREPLPGTPLTPVAGAPAAAERVAGDQRPARADVRLTWTTLSLAPGRYAGLSPPM